MSYLIIGIVFFAILFSASFIIRRTRDEDIQVWGTVTRWSSFAVLAGGIVFSTFRVVPPGHIGVVTTFGKVHEVPLTEGLHVVLPVSEVNIMTIQIQKTESSYTSASKDLQQVNVRMIITYRLDPKKAIWVFRFLGPTPEFWMDKVVNPTAQEALKANTALYNASEILKQRPKIRLDVHNDISTELGKSGITVRQASLADISFSTEYARAIEQKQLKEQLAEQKKHELKQAQLEAQIRAAVARGEADAKREEAKGRADALKIEGDAQAEYNTKVARSLTTNLITNEYIKRWDGKLPQMLTGSNTGILFQVPLGRRK